MPFEPLTEEQYNNARGSGFTHDKIVEFEKRRKAEFTPQPGLLKSVYKAIAEPIANIVARPFQAATSLIQGEKYQPQERDILGLKITNPALEAQRGASSREILQKEAGRGLQTVALGLGPVSGGATYGLGTSLEKGNELISAPTAAYTAGGAAFGKVAKVVGPKILEPILKRVPKPIQEAVGGAIEKVEDVMKKRKILPSGVSKIINQTAESLERRANIPFDKATSFLQKASII